jgi:predicted transcriptional regulator
MASAIGSDLTNAEYNLLAKLWEFKESHKRPATANDLTCLVYPENTPSYYYSVLKLLDNLESKGFVNRDRSRRQHHFDPARDREDLIYDVLLSIREKMNLGRDEDLPKLIDLVIGAADRLGGKNLLAERLAVHEQGSPIPEPPTLPVKNGSRPTLAHKS